MFRNASGNRFRIGRRALSALLVALAVGACWPASGAQPPATLRSLELLIPSTLTLAAAAARIDAADDVIARLRASSGLHYFAQSGLGQRSEVVSIAYGNNTFFRYLQRFGVSLPVLGSRRREQESVLDAQTQSQLRRIDFNAERRILLATLRESYVQYWQFAREEDVAQRYLGLDQAAVEPARSLRSVGFWTQANLLAFLDELDSVKTDVSMQRYARAAAFSKLRAIAGADVSPFDPAEPDLPSVCIADKDRVVASAVRTDGQIQRIDVQLTQRLASLDLVRWSSVEAAVEMGVGGYADAPRGLGYDLTVDLNVNLPMHRKVAERAFDKALRAEILAFRDEADQRRRDLTGDVEADLANLAAAQAAVAHAMVDTAAKDEALRVARVRFANLPTLGAAGFDDVQTRTGQSYASERAAVEAHAQVFLKMNDLLLLAPDACAPAPSASPKPASAP